MAHMASRLAIFRSTSSSPRLFSSSATATATATVSKEQEQNLFRKLVTFGETEPKVGVTLDDWAKDGKRIKRSEIISVVNVLRKNKRFQQALEVYQWIHKSETKMNNADRAIYIDLILKTEGVASAETYFNSLQDSAKTHKTYGALLSCYCNQKMFDKAVELFETVKELNFGSSLNYNNMMSLYLSVGQPEKALSLSKEMEEKKIPADVYTYNQLMKTYAALGDYDSVDGIIEKMGENKIKCDWFTYGNLATIYVNAGFIDKANGAIQKLESMENVRDREAFHTLMTLYSRTSNLPGVYRVWESLKSEFPKTINLSYLVKLMALSNLGDFDGLEKSFREWETSCSMYDARVSNVIIGSYLNRGMIDEAELIYRSIEERGAKPNLKTLDLFTNFYLEKDQMDLALKYFEIGASTTSNERVNWFPAEETVGKFLKHFEEEKDVEGAERFCESMTKLRRVDARVYDSLLRTYIAAGKEEPGMRQRIKEDGVEISPDTEKLLSKVCSD